MIKLSDVKVRPMCRARVRYDPSTVRKLLATPDEEIRS